MYELTRDQQEAQYLRDVQNYTVKLNSEFRRLNMRYQALQHAYDAYRNDPTKTQSLKQQEAVLNKQHQQLHGSMMQLQASFAQYQRNSPTATPEQQQIAEDAIKQSVGHENTVYLAAVQSQAQAIAAEYNQLARQYQQVEANAANQQDTQLTQRMMYALDEKAEMLNYRSRSLTASYDTYLKRQGDPDASQTQHKKPTQALDKISDQFEFAKRASSSAEHEVNNTLRSNESPSMLRNDPFETPMPKFDRRSSKSDDADKSSSNSSEKSSKERLEETLESLYRTQQEQERRSLYESQKRVDEYKQGPKAPR